MKHWPHAPTHLFIEKGTYIVTGATLNKQSFFKNSEDLDLVQNTILQLASLYKWELKAWAIFPNHYHFIAYSCDDPSTLRKFIRHLHANTARELNTKHNSPGRKVWNQFWDTHLSYQISYMARLHYVMNNPVKHGLVERSQLYKWCSSSWFEKTADKSFVKTVFDTKIDAITVEDDFD